MATTATAARVIRTAVDEARRLGSFVVGQEHVILAIGLEPASLAHDVLAAIGLDATSTRAGLLGIITKGWAGPDDVPTPTPRLVRALEEADIEAESSEVRPTTTADLLLGIMRAEVGVGRDVLLHAGVHPSALREATASRVAGHPELAETTDGTSVDHLGAA